MADTHMKMADTHIKDSGTRREFNTGAVRDMAENKGDMVSIPWMAILRLSRHYENGAKKYKRYNYLKGIPVSSFIDSALRHLAKYQCGCDDEDHLSAAAFNILGAMQMEGMGIMQDLPTREGCSTFDYFDNTEIQKKVLEAYSDVGKRKGKTQRSGRIRKLMLGVQKRFR